MSDHVSKQQAWLMCPTMTVSLCRCNKTGMKSKKAASEDVHLEATAKDKKRWCRHDWCAIKSLQMQNAATGKARSPTVDCCMRQMVIDSDEAVFEQCRYYSMPKLIDKDSKSETQLLCCLQLMQLMEKWSDLMTMIILFSGISGRNFLFHCLWSLQALITSVH